MLLAHHCSIVHWLCKSKINCLKEGNNENILPKKTVKKKKGSIFSLPKQRSGRAIALPPALVSVSASASANVKVLR